MTGPVGRVALIQRAVAAEFDVPVAALTGQRRTRDYALARAVAMYLATHLLNFSSPRVGQAFNRDHTTVLHALDKVEWLLDHDAQVAERVRRLRDRIEAALDAVNTADARATVEALDLADGLGQQIRQALIAEAKRDPAGFLAKVRGGRL